MATMLILVKTSLVMLMVVASVMVVMCSQRTEYGCYVPRASPCSSHNITCDDQTRIFIEDLFYGSNPSITKCPAIRDKYDCRSNLCCSPGTSDTPKASTRQDRLLVHKACALQQSCAVTPQYRSNTGYHYCGYRYWCMEESEFYNIITTRRIRDTTSVELYYSSKVSPVKGLTCSCDVSNSVSNVIVNFRYIYLSGKSCNSVKILIDNRRPYSCNNDGVFSGNIKRSYAGDLVRIVFNNMISSDDDVIWINFIGYGGLSASCSCSKVDGGWSFWSPYGRCSESCGEGTWTRRRYCSNPTPINGGKNCTGDSFQHHPCNLENCPVSTETILGILSGVCVLVCLAAVITCYIRRIRTINTPNINPYDKTRPTDVAPSVYCTVTPQEGAGDTYYSTIPSQKGTGSAVCSTVPPLAGTGSAVCSTVPPLAGAGSAVCSTVPPQVGTGDAGQYYSNVKVCVTFE